MNRHIESIRIQDFQNHRDTHIKLVPGLNMITGSSDSGKSALFRSLSLAFLDSFRKQDVRDGQKNAHVTINFKNGDYYKRTKGDVNELEFQYKEQPLQKHTKFAKNFPQDAIDFLGHIPKTSSGALPFANQEDKLFLINLSDEAIPKEISRLLGIQDLEDAASELGADINKVSGDIKRTNIEIDSTKKKLIPFEGLDEKLQNLETIKNLLQEYKELSEFILECQTLFNNFLTMINKVNNCKAQIAKQNSLVDYFSTEIPSLETNYNNIKDGLLLIENMENAKNNFMKCKGQYQKYYEISEGEIGSLISKSIEIKDVFSSASSLEKCISSVEFEISTTSNEIDDENDAIAGYNNEIDTLLKYLHENFELCNECGKPL